MKTCNSCKLEKPLSEFGNKRSAQDGKQPYCKECGRQRDRKHYAGSVDRRKFIAASRVACRTRNREYVVKYLLDHPCVDCGEREPIFLDFDHVKGQKLTDVCTMVHLGYSLAKIEAEIEKCEVRCVKCHRIQTAKRGGWYDNFAEIVRRYDASGNMSVL